MSEGVQLRPAGDLNDYERSALIPQLYEKWSAERPATPTEIERWLLEAKGHIAKTYNAQVEIRTIRRWIAHEHEKDYGVQQADAASLAVALMYQCDISQAKAIAVLDDAMEAKWTRVLPDGNLLERPDHKIRVSAAENILRIAGAYAPEKKEVRTVSVKSFRDMTDEELQSASAEIAKELFNSTGVIDIPKSLPDGDDAEGDDA